MCRLKTKKKKGLETLNPDKEPSGSLHTRFSTSHPKFKPEPTGYLGVKPTNRIVQVHCRKHDTTRVSFAFGQRCVDPQGNPISRPNTSHSSALLYHGTSRGGVQLLLDQPEARTQFKYVPKRRGEAGSHEKEVPEAGPGGTVLLEHERQLEGGHHGGVVGDALQPLAALVQLQVHVEDAAAQAAGLAGGQPQDLARDPPSQLLRHQNGGAVQRSLLGSRQAVFKHLGQLLTAAVFGHICVPLGFGQAVIPEVKFWENNES